jgi:alcohol dehydrogenase class IV
MAYAALCSGITLANAGLGVVHGFASTIGGRFSIPHGLVCASMMGPANEVTFNKLIKNNPDNPFIKKYTRVGRIFFGSTDNDDVFYAEFLINKIHDMALEFKLPKLRNYGFDPELMDHIIAITSNKYNPVQLSQEELKEILEKVV